MACLYGPRDGIMGAEMLKAVVLTGFEASVLEQGPRDVDAVSPKPTVLPFTSSARAMPAATLAIR